MTTNLFSGLYRDIDKFIEWAQSFKVRWNTSYHPDQGMDVDLFIDRVRKLKQARIHVDQVASVDTHRLTPPLISKLMIANIGWRLQYNTGIGINTGCGIKADKNGELLPKTIKDIRTFLPLAWNDFQKYIDDNYSKYLESCGMKLDQEVECSTDRIIIGPDNHLYTCHSLCYQQRKDLSLGHISSLMDMKEKGYKVGTPIKCPIFGRCDPCDTGCIKIKKENSTIWEQY